MIHWGLERRIGKLLDADFESGNGEYQDQEGYIQVARKLRRWYFRPSLDDIWSAVSPQRREALGWEKIKLPLPTASLLKDLLDADFESGNGEYQDQEGYIQAGQELNRSYRDFIIFDDIWSAVSPQRREALGWEKIDHMSLYSASLLKDLLDADFESGNGEYQYQEGQIQAALDVERGRLDETYTGNTSATRSIYLISFDGVWSAVSPQRRETLGWERMDNMSLSEASLLKDLLDGDLESGNGEYQGQEGYIQVARHLSERGYLGTRLDNIWSAVSPQRRETLGWIEKIDLSLRTVSRLGVLLDGDLESGNGEYQGHDGHIRVSRKLEEEGHAPSLDGIRYAVSPQHREALGWDRKDGPAISRYQQNRSSTKMSSSNPGTESTIVF